MIHSRYTWDFGDGSETQSGESLASVSHIYTDDGVYRITVTVADDNGAAVPSQFDCSVANVAPGVKVSGPASVREGLVYHLSARFDRRSGARQRDRMDCRLGG